MDIDDMIDVVFQCKICSVQTLTRDDLRIHIKEAHNNNNKKENCYSSTEKIDVIHEIDSSTTRSGDTNTRASTAVIDLEPSSLTSEDSPRHSKRRRKLSKRVTDNSFQFYSSVSKKSKPSKNDESEVELPIDDVCEENVSNESTENLPKRDQKAKSESFVKTTNSNRSKACLHCRSKFASEEELEIHTNSHYMGIFKCVMCDYTNVNWHRIKIHMETHNKPDTHLCDECDQTFSSQYSLYNHKRFSHLGGTRLCEDCGFQASSKYQLVQHRMKTHVMQLSCPMCGFICDNELDMKEHRKLRHESGYICKLCKSSIETRTYRTKEALQDHLAKDHNGRKCFFCDKCNYVAKLRHHLDKHNHMHTGTRPYACKYDGCLFRTRDHRNLRQHMIMKHRNPGDMVCRQCQFVTTIQNEWDVHQAMFHMKVFQCEQCTYTSRSKAAIRRHRLAKHTAEDKMRYPCQYCSYKTNLKECLQKHLLTHDTKTKDYKCPFCFINLTDRNLMMKHLQDNHPGKEIFSCSLCPYIAKTVVLLKQHSQTHNKEKPYSCEKCCYSGRTKNLLQSHMLHKHHISSRDLKKGKNCEDVGKREATTSDVESNGLTSFTTAVMNERAEVEISPIGRTEEVHSNALPEESQSNAFTDKTHKVKRMSAAKLSKLVQMEMRRISGEPSSGVNNAVDVGPDLSHVTSTYILLPPQNELVNQADSAPSLEESASLLHQTEQESFQEDDSPQLATLTNYDPRKPPDAEPMQGAYQPDAIHLPVLDIVSSSLNQEVPILTPLSPTLRQ